MPQHGASMECILSPKKPSQASLLQNRNTSSILTSCSQNHLCRLWSMVVCFSHLLPKLPHPMCLMLRTSLLWLQHRSIYFIFSTPQHCWAHEQHSPAASEHEPPLRTALLSEGGEMDFLFKRNHPTLVVLHHFVEHLLFTGGGYG